MKVDDELELRRLHDRQVGGFLASDDTSGVQPGLAQLIGNVCSVTHHAADFRKLAPRVDGGQPMVRGKCSELHATVGKEGVGTDHQRVGSLIHKARKRCIKFVNGAGGTDFDLRVDGGCRSLQFCDSARIQPCGWIEQHAKTRRPWHQLTQEG
jgi:hypothetical protein